MVESGQAQIRPVDFASRLHPRLPVEVIERSDLVKRVDPELFGEPERLSFHTFLLVRSEIGSHTVDFTEIPAKCGRLIQIRPGQIQIWNTAVELDATLVLSQPAISSAQAWFPGHGSYCDLDGDALMTAEALVDSLRRQQACFGDSQTNGRLMIALFDTLVALFDQSGIDKRDTNLPGVYVEFRSAIETDLARSHNVIDYADKLGYSARTITRACQQATGQTAKRILTDRLVLEAKRMLVHTEIPAAAISAQLGFSEPTNFTKFFVRNTNRGPTDFRIFHKRDN